MWKRLISTSRRGFSARSILTYVLPALFAALLWATTSTQTAYAASASWQGNTIVYESKTFVPSTTPLPAGISGTYYKSVQPSLSGGTEYGISFAPGVNVNTATSARYTVYTFNASGTFSGPTTDSTISLIPKTQSGSNSSEAVWLNGNLVYDGKTFTGSNGTFRTSNGTNSPLPNGTKYYEYVDSASRKSYFLYFSSSTDPPAATSAQYISYTYASNPFGTGIEWSSPSSATTVSINTETVDNTDSSNPATQTSCDVPGVGWIVCPVSNFLAWGMDNIFQMLKGFLQVEPLSTNTDSGLYQAWNVIRTIANIAFVIAFLIIIFSQLTGLGISNYGLKSLLPRLIIAAILVNLSYLISAAAVDLSNIAGFGVERILLDLRESLNGPNTNQVATWGSVTSLVLAAGTGVTAAAVTIGGVVVSSGASLGAALILLLPMLLGLILAVLVALLVLAARQALIVILIILAPLAFVAYLLPNTQKLFERWRGLFITLLVFFPLFALIFGGSQLAAFLIIQTASGDNALNIILLALFVQVAPLILTPLLVRFSGNIIGKIANLVNDPKKGLIDRTRSWAKEESEYMAARNMARRDPMRTHQVFRRFAQSQDRRKRMREGRTAAYRAWSDSQWYNTREFSDIDQLTREASDVKTIGESRSAERYSTWKGTNYAGQRVDTQLRTAQLQMENASTTLEQRWEANHSATVVRERARADSLAKSISMLKEEHKRDFAELDAGRVSPRLQNVQGINSFANTARETLRRSQIANSAISFAQQQQQLDFAKLLQENLEIARDAGGVAEQGAKRAQSNAIAVITRAKAETIKAIKDSTSVKAGDVAGMLREIASAVAQNDAVTVRAYIDMLSESANPGIEGLRGAVSLIESRMSGDELQDIRDHINASPAINSGAEDIATWSRDLTGRSIREVTRDAKTYKELTPVAFASNKKSTQIEAFKTGAIDATFARNVLNNPAARGSLKPSMQKALENIVAGRNWYDGVDVNLNEDD